MDSGVALEMDSTSSLYELRVSLSLLFSCLFLMRGCAALLRCCAAFAFAFACFLLSCLGFAFCVRLLLFLLLLCDAAAAIPTFLLLLYIHTSAADPFPHPRSCHSRDDVAGLELGTVGGSGLHDVPARLAVEGLDGAALTVQLGLGLEAADLDAGALGQDDGLWP